MERPRSIAGQRGTAGCILPATHHHYAYTENEGATIDLGFYGPFQIYYVNPADDPSK